MKINTQTDLGQTLSSVAIITARKGSVRLPHKNRILLPYTVKFIQRSELFTHLILTTDDDVLFEEVDNLSNLCVHKVQRPKHLALEVTGREHFRSIMHAMDECFLNPEGKICTLLQPTSPFRRISHIRCAIDLIRQNTYNSVFSVDSHGRLNGNFWAWRHSRSMTSLKIPPYGTFPQNPILSIDIDSSDDIAKMALSISDQRKS